MGLPAILAKGAKGAFRGTPFGGLAMGFAEGAMGAVARGGGGRKRRRKARLTQGDILELNNIKNILGRTAAANALPYYLGRGRG